MAGLLSAWMHSVGVCLCGLTESVGVLIVQVMAAMHSRCLANQTGWRQQQLQLVLVDPKASSALVVTAPQQQLHLQRAAQRRNRPSTHRPIIALNNSSRSRQSACLMLPGSSYAVWRVLTQQTSTVCAGTPVTPRCWRQQEMMG